MGARPQRQPEARCCRVQPCPQAPGPGPPIPGRPLQASAGLPAAERRLEALRCRPGFRPSAPTGLQARGRFCPRALQTTSGRSWHWAPASASRLLQWGQGLASAVVGAITAPHTLQYPAVLWLPE
jgi:hypothetical protein